MPAPLPHCRSQRPCRGDGFRPSGIVGLRCSLLSSRATPDTRHPATVSVVSTPADSVSTAATPAATTRGQPGGRSTARPRPEGHGVVPQPGRDRVGPVRARRDHEQERHAPRNAATVLPDITRDFRLLESGVGALGGRIGSIEAESDSNLQRVRRRFVEGSSTWGRDRPRNPCSAPA